MEFGSLGSTDQRSSHRPCRRHRLHAWRSKAAAIGNDDARHGASHHGGTIGGHLRTRHAVLVHLVTSIGDRHIHRCLGADRNRSVSGRLPRHPREREDDQQQMNETCHCGLSNNDTGDGNDIYHVPALIAAERYIATMWNNLHPYNKSLSYALNQPVPGSSLGASTIFPMVFKNLSWLGGAGRLDCLRLHIIAHSSRSANPCDLFAGLAFASRIAESP